MRLNTLTFMENFSQQKVLFSNVHTTFTKIKKKHNELKCLNTF